jgi:hypothetical protein
VIALVEVHLRAGAAGARVAHGPEVVFLAQAEDAILDETGHALPELERLVVLVEDGGLQALLGQPEVDGEQLPAEGDGFLLEVVAEGEVAQHLEEGVVPGRAPHVLEIVVLAARAHALLGGDGSHVLAALLPEEHALELIHPRVGEE